MPRRTNSDIIRDLENAVATLTERIDNVRNDVERLRDTDVAELRRETKRLNTETSDLNKDLALVKQQTQQATRQFDRGDRRTWAVRLAMLTAIISGIVSLVVTMVQNGLK